MKVTTKPIYESFRSSPNRVNGLHLAKLLSQLVTANAANDIADQHSRNGQIKFDKKTARARTQLKKIGAIQAVSNGFYKLVNLTRLEKIAADVKLSAVNGQPPASAMKPLPMIRLAEALTNPEPLSWEERLSAFAHLLRDGIRTP